MARVKRAVNAQKKRRTTLELASGYRGQRSRLYRKAKEQMLHSLNYAYRDRRARRATSGSCGSPASTPRPAQNEMTYNRFIQGLKIAGVEVDRKILAELAVSEPAAFAALVEVARANVPAQDGTAAEHSGSPAPGTARHRTHPARRRSTQAAAPHGPRSGRAVPRRGRPGRP